jgi:hypothetical protein
VHRQTAAVTDPDPSLPETTAPEPTTDDDHGAALERSADAIQDAQEAGGGVAANDDITSLDERREGENSDNPDGGGGLP